MSQKQSKKSNKDLVLEFANFLKFKKGLSANTISAYESDITQFLEFTGENIINNDLIELFITSELNDKSDNSKIRKISSINQYIDWFNLDNKEYQIVIEKVSLKKSSYLPETISVSEYLNPNNLEFFIDTTEEEYFPLPKELRSNITSLSKLLKNMFPTNSKEAVNGISKDKSWSATEALSSL